LTDRYAIGGLIQRYEGRPKRVTLAWLLARQSRVARHYLPRAIQLANGGNEFAARVLLAYERELIELDALIAERQQRRRGAR